MSADEPAEEGEGGPPPHPLDRVWFHPSELHAFMAESQAPGRRRDWGVVAVSALGGAALAAGILLGVGAFGDSRTSGNGAFPLVEASDRLPTAQLAAGARSSIVSILVGGPEGAPDRRVGSGLSLGRRRIVTSARLLTGATKVSVLTANGRSLQAEVVGQDAATDLAVLTVDADVAAARWSSADALAVGARVVAVAAGPADQRWVSEGVISSVNRVAARADGALIVGLLETDTTAADDRAGGALLDEQGNVVGILAAGWARPGLAMPIDVVIDVTDQIVIKGRALHTWLGVVAVDAALGGARVVQVAAESPASVAKLASGDVIMAVGGSTVASAADLLAVLQRRKPGDPLRLTVLRAGKRIRPEAELGTRSDDAAAWSAPDGAMSN